jgi:hypothetical protein
MRSRIRQLLIVISVGVSVFSLMTPIKLIASTSTPSKGILDMSQSFGDSIGLSDTDPRIIIMRLIRVALGFIGIILLIMFILSGARFMTSGGDDEKVKKAKKTFYSAIIGIIIILSSYSIVEFVINSFISVQN